MWHESGKFTSIIPTINSTSQGLTLKLLTGSCKEWFSSEDVSKVPIRRLFLFTKNWLPWLYRPNLSHPYHTSNKDGDFLPIELLGNSISESIIMEEELSSKLIKLLQVMHHQFIFVMKGLYGDILHSSKVCISLWSCQRWKVIDK